ncbi:MAG TPA: anthranilate phosphoribosyltransferase [Longimicrobiales bacterium]|nr:anthranilate phosphoribosyltransferase [Longimicrobiales bacterium]
MSPQSSPHPLTAALEAVAQGRALSAAEAEAAFDSFMDGSASEVQMAGLLVGLRAKGIAPAEVAGGVRALRKAMRPVPVRSPAGLVDTAGTGGGSVTTFNISTAAALVVAGAGVPVAKHGNRSFTSRCGSADVLEALDVCIELTPESMARVLDEAGIVFMFAPLLHPAMRHVGPVRKALGITTIMNILGPLTNPAGAKRQVVGVADPALLDLIPDALAELGHVHALVVHGAPGLDEVSPAGTTRVAELREGTVRRYEIEPSDLGLEPVALDDIAGADPAENARLIEGVLAGKDGGARSAVVANAAAALLVAGVAESGAQGARLAETTLDEGGGADALERLREASARAGAAPNTSG